MNTIDIVKISSDAVLLIGLSLSFGGIFKKIGCIERKLHTCDKKMKNLQTHLSYIKTAVEAISEIKVKRD